MKQCDTSHWILQKKESFYLTELNGINHWIPKKKKSFCPNQLVLQKNKIFRLAEQFGINHWILHKNKRQQNGLTPLILHKNKKEQNDIRRMRKKSKSLRINCCTKRYIIEEKIYASLESPNLLPGSRIHLK